MKSIYLAFFILFLQSCVAQPGEKIPTKGNENTLLWEISGNGLSVPSYLFGSFHMMCPNEIHFSKEVKQALNASEEVYFEMDLDDPSNTLGALLFINMKEGKTLKDLYNAEEYSRLDHFFNDTLGITLNTVNKMKPGMLGAMLYPKLMPCKNMSGVELELLKLAMEKKKEVKGFETIADQAAVFDSIPYETQAKELLNTVDSFNFYRKSFDTLLLVYKTQQLDALEKLFSKSEFGMDQNNDILLDKRNLNWIEQIKKILPGKNIFIAVGAGHLVGKKGLIALLRKEGFTLRPLENK